MVLFFLFRFTDQFCGRITIHFGHMAIHKDQIIGNTTNSLHGLQAIRSHVSVITEFVKHPYSDFLIDQIIFS
jgi:hypothetical protein